MTNWWRRKSSSKRNSRRKWSSESEKQGRRSRRRWRSRRKKKQWHPHGLWLADNAVRLERVIHTVLSKYGGRTIVQGGGARRGRASAAAAAPVSGRKLREFGCVVTLLLRSLIRLLSDPHWDYFLLLAAGRSSRIYGQNRFGPTAPRGPGE